MVEIEDIPTFQQAGVWVHLQRRKSEENEEIEQKEQKEEIEEKSEVKRA